jgi:hypothetical protein
MRRWEFVLGSRMVMVRAEVRDVTMNVISKSACSIASVVLALDPCTLTQAVWRSRTSLNPSRDSAILYTTSFALSFVRYTVSV